MNTTVASLQYGSFSVVLDPPVAVPAGMVLSVLLSEDGAEVSRDLQEKVVQFLQEQEAARNRPEVPPKTGFAARPTARRRRRLLFEAAIKDAFEAGEQACYATEIASGPSANAPDLEAYLPGAVAALTEAMDADQALALEWHRL